MYCSCSKQTCSASLKDSVLSLEKGLGWVGSWCTPWGMCCTARSVWDAGEGRREWGGRTQQLLWSCVHCPATSLFVSYDDFFLVKIFSVLQLCIYVWIMTLGFTLSLGVDLWKLMLYLVLICCSSRDWHTVSVLEPLGDGAGRQGCAIYPGTSKAFH